MKKLLLVISASLLLVGCSGVKQLGTIGGTKYYQVKSQSIVGPNITMIVSEKNNEVTNETAASGAGIGSSVVSAVGNVGASAAFGLSLRPSKYNNTTSTTTSNGNDITAAGGAANAAATGNGTVQSTTTGGTYNRVNGNSANAPGHNK